jgi:3-methyladenine DNA glycosylase AlkD
VTADELLEDVRRKLSQQIEPVYREGARAFFKEEVDLYGVRTPKVRRVAADAYREVKHWPDAARNSFCRELWKSGKFEEGGIAVAVYQRLRRQCASREFRLFEKWIDRWVRNWAHCDGVSSWLLSASIENEPSLIRLLPPWTKSPNRWKRRAAAVSLLQEAKRGRHTDAIFDIARRLIEDEDDMVRKGVGWVLKETYPAKPRETVQFIESVRDRSARLVLRIAAEKMTPRDRERVLRRDR